MSTQNQKTKDRGLGFVLLFTALITAVLVCIKIFLFPDSQLN